VLTILGYSLYDTIIVFDRIRENVPRMPRATFSQIVNRSMAEVLTRSLATSFSTLLPIMALLLFGGETLKDFGFALLVGVASGTYSSIFIASPVLTHWKEREPLYQRRRRVVMEDNNGVVPPYAEGTLAGEEEPAAAGARRRTPGRREAPAAATPARPASGAVAQTAVQEAPPETAPEPPPAPSRKSDGSDGQSAQDDIRAKAEARRQQRKQQRKKHGRR
jgi:SecD/SecF fusion protein